MKLIEIDISEYVIVDDSPAIAGDFVLINVPDGDIKNHIRQVIEVHPHEIGVSDNNLVFEYNSVTSTANIMGKSYCEKIIYSTSPLNGVKFLDIDYVRSLFDYMKTKITLTGQDLVKIITEFKEKRPMSINCFVSDFIASKTEDTEQWEVELKGNYPVLKSEKKDVGKDILIKHENYVEVLETLKKILNAQVDENVTYLRTHKAIDILLMKNETSE